MSSSANGVASTATVSSSTSSLVTTGLSAVGNAGSTTSTTATASSSSTASRQPVAAASRPSPSVLLSTTNATAARPLPTLAGTDPLPQPTENTLMSRKRLQDVVQEINPNQSLDEDVEDFLLASIDAFVDNAIAQSCDFAKHRNSTTLGTRDLQLYLERNYNMYIPGFGSERTRAYKKPFTTEAHKQRLNLIRKAVKK